MSRWFNTLKSSGVTTDKRKKEKRNPLKGINAAAQRRPKATRALERRLDRFFSTTSGKSPWK